MSEHSCFTAASLLRVCCKSVQLLPHQALQQLQTSIVCQRLTAILKISSSQRGPPHANATTFESVRMYSSMLLVSLTSELGETVLQVAHLMPTLSLKALTPLLATFNAQQLASHLRRNQ